MLLFISFCNLLLVATNPIPSVWLEFPRVVVSHFQIINAGCVEQPRERIYNICEEQDSKLCTIFYDCGMLNPYTIAVFVCLE